MHRLFYVAGGKQYDITPLIGKFSWSSSHREMAQKISFSAAFNDDRYFPIIPIDLGGLVVLHNNGVEVLRGIVVEEPRSGRKAREYTGLDFAFYLNRFADTYQFNTSAEAAIRKICTDVGLPIGNLTVTGVRINKIYNDTSRADIISDIREQVEKATGKAFRLEMRGPAVYFEPQTELLISPRFRQASNLAELPGALAISDPRRTRKIQWGKDGEKVIEAADLTLPGDNRIRAGRVIEFDEPVTGLAGKYFITDATHTVEAGIHTVAMGLEAVA